MNEIDETREMDNVDAMDEMYKMDEVMNYLTSSYHYKSYNITSDLS